MEHLIKRELLRDGKPKKLVLLCPDSERPGNRVLLDKMAPYITVVRDEEQLPRPKETMISALEEYFLCESLDGLTKHW
jgi:hypothetical protein